MRTRIWLAALGALLGAVALPVVVSARSTCFGQPATIMGDRDGETILGTSDGDVIISAGGNDRIFARGGSDLICAGGGMDRVRGGKGSDRINGGRGSDVPFRSNRRHDVFAGLLGNAGDDFIKGGNGIDRLQGGPGNDVLKGGLSSDLEGSVTGQPGEGTGIAGGEYHASWDGGLVGGGGSDRLSGGRRDDYLDSRDGIEANDRLNGGEGKFDYCRSDPDPRRGCEENL
jgi:Ca2+-binding RTX toxin-like protein